ncbi:hypothetical protein [Roseibium litorale]|uniref:Uncharacterized protein n=1 Tax=Roseibium litorale TaxID=2803841 RepID=A0ABR9CHC6_9HYPH|nr:hypothetical protein [Roseibium litorale]MBD8890158.1 hypothetical protein [Roseibium litorale]
MTHQAARRLFKAALFTHALGNGVGVIFLIACVFAFFKLSWGIGGGLLFAAVATFYFVPVLVRWLAMKAEMKMRALFDATEKQRSKAPGTRQDTSGAS